MYKLLSVLAIGASAAATPPATAPTVSLRNGTYYGVHLPHYGQDVFLGMPYAQPPVGELRFRAAQPLDSSWTGGRNATAYGPECIGYGSDQWVLGNVVSEDCLTLNVVRPSGGGGGSTSSLLPVAVWIHGGGFYEGGSRDPRYNLTFLVRQSVAAGQPVVAVSLNYRLAQWGWLAGAALAAEGSLNAAVRDQRLALRWVQENIAAFGGDPARVTIWGESAGAHSVGIQLVAYGGRHDGLFRAAIAESGAPVGFARHPTVADWQPAFDGYSEAAGCGDDDDAAALACLRAVPADVLSAVFNTSGIARPAYEPIVDGDFFPRTGAAALRTGAFARVPLLTGCNFDEGGALGTRGINTTAQFLAMVRASYADDTSDDDDDDDDACSHDNPTAHTLAALYPDIPAIGIPATLHGRPAAGAAGLLGAQWKRSAAFAGDVYFHAARRMASAAWARRGVPSWSYHFDVLVHGIGPEYGSVHFQEVAFVMDNVGGLGYDTAVSVDPFAGEPPAYAQLAHTMARLWVSFVAQLDPNALRASPVYWPPYTLDSPQNLVFDANVSDLAYVQPDLYRAEGIAYLSSIFETVYGR